MTDARGRSGSPSVMKMSLCHAHAPTTASELTVPLKKLEVLREWFLSAGASRRALCAVGPPGCGKASAIRVLAREQGYDVHEWTPPTPTLWHEHAHVSSSFTEFEYTSKVDEFVGFVARATKYAPLSFLNSRGSTTKKTLLMIRDIPSSDGAGRAKVLDALRVLANASNSPCAVILTIEQEEGGAGASSSSNAIIRATMESAGALCVSFNPVTTAAMAKALTRVCEAERLDVPSSHIDALAQTSLGDIRSALGAIEFWCQKSTRPKDAGDDVEAKSKVKRKRVPRTKEAPSAEAQAQARARSRDQGLGLFHALGKILYNKRELSNDDVSSSPLFANLSVDLKRPPMKYDPENVLARASIGAETATSFLFENFPDFMDTISLERLALGVRYMSDAMIVARGGAAIFYGSAHSRAREDVSGDDVDPWVLAELCAGSMATRAILFSSKGASSGFLKLRGPAWTDRAIEQNKSELRSVVAAAHAGDFAIGGATSACAALETLPALRLLANASAEGAARVPHLPTKWWRVGEDAASFERRCANLPHDAVAPRPNALAAGVGLEIDRGAVGIHAAPLTLDDIDHAEDDIEDDSDSDSQRGKREEDDIELDDWIIE